MPPAISNVAAAPSLSFAAAALSRATTLPPPSSFIPDSSLSSLLFTSSRSHSLPFAASSFSPEPTITHDHLEPRNFFGPDISSWPTSYDGGGNFYSFYCPPGVTYFGCRITAPVTTPVASATAVGPPPPPPPPPPPSPTSLTIVTPAVPTTSATLVVSQTLVTSTAKTATSPMTNPVPTSAATMHGGSSTSTLLTMSSTPSSPSAPSTSSGSGSVSDGGSSLKNTSTVVILSSILSVVGVMVVAVLVLICCRLRQRRGGSFLPRGISPIDDDEIETWKGTRGLPEGEASENEKGPSGLLGKPTGGHDGPDSPPLPSAGALGAGATVQRRDQLRPRTHSYPERVISLDGSGIVSDALAPLGERPVRPPKKTPSNVIIYRDPPQSFPGLPNSASSTNGFPPILGVPVAPAAAAAGAAGICYLQQGQQRQSVPLYRRSEEFSPRSVRSMSFGYPASRGMAGRFSFDQDCDFLFSQTIASPSTPPTALQHARAPNSRAGLTDDTIPGDPSFLPTPKRQPSRLFKMPPATGSPSATAAETAAATEAVAAGGAGIAFPPRRNSHGARGSSNIPSPPENSSSHSDSNRGSFWHARTRSARSCSTVSYAGSDVPLNQSFRHMPHQRRPSVVQYQSISHPLALTPPQQSPTSILQQQVPVPPLPMSARPNPDNSDSVNIDRRSSHSMFDEYLQQEKQPRDVSSLSTLAASASSSVLPHMFTSGAAAAAGASDDSDGPLLDGLSPPRLSVSDSRHIVYERRSSSLHHLTTIGRAIG